MQADFRKPLSPVKANGQYQRVTHSKEDINRKQQAAQEEEDVFAQSTTKPKKQSDKIPAFYVSKIPRATLSPVAATSRHAASGSKIPKPAIPAVSAGSERPGSASPIAGFQSYSNPSFVDTTHNLTGDHSGLAICTPEAVQILQQAGNDTSNEHIDAKNIGMGAIINAYLRTGPQKLSPEPSKDYFILAPKPAAVPPGAAGPKYVSAASGVPMTAEEYLRIRAQYLPLDPVRGNNNNNDTGKVPAPQPKHPTSQIPALVMKKEEQHQMEQQPAFPEPAPTPEVKNIIDESSLQGTTPASVCSNIPDVFDDFLNGGGSTPASEAVPERRTVASGIKIRLLPAVDSQQTTMADSQATTADVPGTNYTRHHQHGHGAVPASPTFMPKPEEEENDAVPDKREIEIKRPSPVAFVLPSSSGGDEKQQQSGGGEASGDGPAGSFSFKFLINSFLCFNKYYRA